MLSVVLELLVIALLCEAEFTLPHVHFEVAQAHEPQEHAYAINVPLDSDTFLPNFPISHLPPWIIYEYLIHISNYKTMRLLF